VFERVRDYFQKIADILDDEKEASSVFPNPTDKGQSRENALKQFLEEHLPKRCETIRGGFLFDSNGNESKQLDLIITNDLTLQFKKFAITDGKAFVAIEGCYSVISVKSELTKQSMFDAFDEMISIPKMPKLNINPGLKFDHTLLPRKFIFGFSGDSGKSILKNLLDYINVHNISPKEFVNFIIVNNKFMIEKIGKKGAKTKGGRDIPPYTYHLTENINYLGGFALFKLIHDIQVVANVGSQIILDFDKYANKILDTM